MNEFEKMREGRLYNPDTPELVNKRLKTRELVNQYNALSPFDSENRKRLIKEIFPNARGNDKCFFEPNIRTEYGDNVNFGDNFYMNFDCMLLDVAKIEIGDNVMFGPRVILATPMHPLLSLERNMQQYPDGYHDIEYAKKISVGNNVWIATNVTVCGGVSIGDNTVIASGAVVTKDIPSNVLAGGVPCRVIRQLDDEKDRMNVWESYINGNKRI